MLGRRDFLRRLLTGAAGMAIGAELDIDRLLWVPKPIITVPAAMGETVVSVDWVTMEALRLLKNNLTLTSTFTRAFDDSFGERIEMRLPRRRAA